MNYTDFQVMANSVSNFQTFAVPARSTTTAANLYVRIAGVAHFDIDPTWEIDDLAWARGTLLINTDPVLQATDTLVEHALAAGIRRLTRDEGGSTDDFGMAIDESLGVEVSGSGNLTVTLAAGYKGDAWTPEVSFTADLLVYREALDLPVPASTHIPWIYFIREVSRLRDLLGL